MLRFIPCLFVVSAIRHRVAAVLFAAAVSWPASATAQDDQLIVAGSPGYDSTTGSGFQDGIITIVWGSAVNNSGTAVGRSTKYVSGSYIGSRAVRWDGTGTSATELGNLGTDISGVTFARAIAVNDAGTAVGDAKKYDAGVDKGDRAVRWDATGAATELGSLGVNSDGYSQAFAYAVNEAGTAVGYVRKYDAGVDKGGRAVRWDASGTAIELGNLGLSPLGQTSAIAYAVNEAGTAVGYSFKYESGSYKGDRAVRWDGAGTLATELGNLGTSPSGNTRAQAYAINETGTAAGYSEKYDGGTYLGTRAVRWDVSGTAIELGNLGLSPLGQTSAFAYSVNDSGTVVGSTTKFVSGASMGSRAVRWDNSGTAVELGNLGTSNGVTLAAAFAVNEAGTAVGYSRKYISGFSYGERAVIWLPDASVIDLNDLGVVANPNDGSWVLTSAKALSSDGWVAGDGTFAPTLGAAYQRAWVAQVGLGGTWTDSISGTLDGTWGRGKQWSTGTPAMQVGDATFSANDSYTVGLDRNEKTRSITVSGGDVSLNLNGYTLTSMTETSVANARLNVSNGTLAGAVAVNGGGTLGGTGTVAGPVMVHSGGALAPGSSIGTLHLGGDLNLGSDSALAYEVNSNAAPFASADLVNVGGNLSIAPTAKLNYTNSANGLFTAGTKLTVVSYAGTWDGGEFVGHADDGLSFLQGQGFVVNYNDTNAGVNQGGGAYGNHLTLTATTLDGRLVVAGSPGYDSTTGNGFRDGDVAVAPGLGVNNGGVAIGYSEKYESGNSLGTRAVRWDGMGTATTELGNLGTSSGVTHAIAYAINDNTIVGWSEKYDQYGNSLGSRAVQWNAAGIATELGVLGTNSNYTNAYAYALNSAGTAVGYAEQYGELGNYLGTRAVRWDGTAATELGKLWSDDNIAANAQAYDVSGTEIIVGWSDKFNNGDYVGRRAVRWNALGTTATELDGLGTNSSGHTNAYAIAVSEAGTAVGFSEKYDSSSSHNYLGERAVRWNAGGAAVSELNDLGTDSNGVALVRAYAMNEAGTAIGFADKFDGLGNYMGRRAVRWDAGGIVATELQTLGTDNNGVTYAYALAVNEAGTTVGFSDKYVANTNVGQRAVIWLPDARVIDLNDIGVVAQPNDGTWLLTHAKGISSDGWVAGLGTFTPMSGSAYSRNWVAQVGLGGTWTDSISGTLDGTWGRGKQWSTGTPAMQIGDATFSVSESYTVTLDRNESTRTIRVTAGTVTIATSGHDLQSMGDTSISSEATLAVDDSVGGNVSAGSLSGTGRLQLGSQTFTVGGSGASATFSGRIEGVGGVTKTGTGTQTLTGANTYTGITSVTGGTLLVSNTTGSGTGSGDVNVVGGTLGGTGSIAGAVAIGSGGTLAPGASIETLDVGTLTFNTGSAFSYEMNTNLSLTVAADLVNASGDLNFAASDVALDISDAGSTLLAAGAKFTLIAYSGDWNGGTFAGRPNNSLLTVGLNTYALRYNDTTMGQNFASQTLAGAGVHYVTLTAVPEAGGFVMLGLVGSVASVCVWWKRQHRQYLNSIAAK